MKVKKICTLVMLRPWQLPTSAAPPPPQFGPAQYLIGTLYTKHFNSTSHRVFLSHTPVLADDKVPK